MEKNNEKNRHDEKIMVQFQPKCSEYPQQR